MAAPGQDAQLHFWAWEGSDAHHPCPAPCTEPLHGSLPAPGAASRRRTEPCKTRTASGRCWADSASQPTTASLSQTNSKQRLHLCGWDFSSLINIPKPTLPLGPTAGSPVLPHIQNAFWDGTAVSLTPSEPFLWDCQSLLPWGWEYKVQLPICTTSIPFPATKELWPDCQSICHTPTLSLVYLPSAQVFSKSLLTS